MPGGNCPRNLKSLLVTIVTRWIVTMMLGFLACEPRCARNSLTSYRASVRLLSIRCPRVTARWLIARVPNFSALLPTHRLSRWTSPNSNWRNTRSWLRANINCWSCDLESIRFKRAFRTIVLHAVCVLFFSFLFLLLFIHANFYTRVINFCSVTKAH